MQLVATVSDSTVLLLPSCVALNKSFYISEPDEITHLFMILPPHNFVGLTK